MKLLWITVLYIVQCDANITLNDKLTLYKDVDIPFIAQTITKVPRNTSEGPEGVEV
jgi:hypothetical protein